ncbi:MAG: hypothetical protein HC831_03985, partial [Chloroflexia bacterium]|nr:hypothetical protein [Chloroflexia bacterium]
RTAVVHWFRHCQLGLLAPQLQFDPIELVRCIATARILMPESRVRLSAGRMAMSRELQALCFFAGANSISMPDKEFLTINNINNRSHSC